ncbi:ABC transporter permease, partial [Xanthomonas vesicatoria]|nr:ABC transporter permease [Xanthomonas vesicatoria]
MSRSTAARLPPLPPVRAEYELAVQPLDPALVAM